MSTKWRYRLTEADLERAKKLRDERFTVDAIARRLKRNPTTVSVSLKEAGYSVLKRGWTQGERSPELSADFGELPAGHPLAELDRVRIREHEELARLDRLRQAAKQERRRK
jgi:hypothetical protein